MQYQKLLQFPDISYSCNLHKRHLIASLSLNTQLFSNELSQSQGNLYERNINKQFFWLKQKECCCKWWLNSLFTYGFFGRHSKNLDFVTETSFQVRLNQAELGFIASKTTEIPLFTSQKYGPIASFSFSLNLTYSPLSDTRRMRNWSCRWKYWKTHKYRLVHLSTTISSHCGLRGGRSPFQFSPEEG